MRQLNPDIRTWAPAERDYLEVMKAKVDGHTTSRGEQTTLHLDSGRVYALCKVFIADAPNGFYTFVRRGKPLDNIVWWDFLLKFEQTILHVVRTAHLLEAHVYDSDPASLAFDPQLFLSENLRTFDGVIEAQLDAFERHSVYLNHYHSYRACAEWLWDELKELDLEPPAAPPAHLASRATVDDYTAREQAFVAASHKFHVLAKSLILHAAFMAEACLNTLFRVGAAPPLRVSEPAMKHLVRANFRDKLKMIRACSIVFSREPDVGHPAVQAAFELMELRNKYVHSDESSRHNKLAEVRFDGDFPLHPVSGFTPGVDFALRVLHKPSRSQLEKAYEGAKAFCGYLLALVDPEFREDMRRMLELTQIGFNHAKGVYSSVYTATPFSFFLAVGDGTGDESGEA